LALLHLICKLDAFHEGIVVDNLLKLIKPSANPDKKIVSINLQILDLRPEE
jgi:hypothetical protein